MSIYIDMISSIKIYFLFRIRHSPPDSYKNEHKKSSGPKSTAFFMLCLVLYVRHHSQMTCSLNSNCQRSLMFCTVSGDSSGKNLTSLRYVSFQFCDILVINLIVFFSTEYTYFFSSAAASSLHRRIRSLTSVICHETRDLVFLSDFYTNCPLA